MASARLASWHMPAVARRVRMRPRQADGSYTNPSLGIVVLYCRLERALESEMDRMNGQHGNGGNPRFSGCCAVCFCCPFLASKRLVLDRQHGRNRLTLGLGSAGVIQ